MLGNSANDYGTVSKVVHWLSAVLVIAMIGVGVYMTGLDREDPLRAQLTGLHKPTGVMVLVLTLIRLAWLAVSPPPPLPAALAAWERVLTRVVAIGFYALLIALPVVGIGMADFADKPANMYGLFEFPQLLDKNIDMAKALVEVHEILAFAMLALLVLHVAGTIKHRYIDEGDVDVLRRII